MGQHNFTYDHVFGGNAGAPPGILYVQCVQPLVEGLFKGYNATVFAYGTPHSLIPGPRMSFCRGTLDTIIILRVCEAGVYCMSSPTQHLNKC